MKKKIDWKNQLIAFVATLLGIVIAFQLEDWKERSNENAKIKKTLISIKLEIEKNISIYNANIAKISDFFEYTDFVLNHRKGDEIISKESDIYYIKTKNPDKFKDIKFIKKYNDSLNEYSANIGFEFPSILTGISTNNWEAAKNTGTVANMDHEMVSRLTFIYEWINKDLGYNDSDFYKSLIEKEGKIDDLDQIKKKYRKILNIYKLKKEKIEEKYITITWNIN